MPEMPLNDMEVRASAADHELDTLLPPAWAELRRRWAALEAEGVVLGPPVACALHDELVRRAREGDEEALADLLAAVPKDLPAGIVRRHRDAAIRKMGARLWSTHLGMTESRAATILAAAGARVASGRSLGEGKPFGSISVAERDRLASEIKAAQAWTNRKWPKRTRIIDILLIGD